MFWSLFLSRGLQAREPASVACDNEHGDLFYSATPHGENALATATARKRWREDLEDMKLNEVRGIDM